MQNFEASDCHGSVRALERRDALRRWTRRLAYCAIVAAVCFGGFRGYTFWRKGHLARQTEQFVARGDYPSAVLVARRLLELDANNLAACRAMAEMADKTGQPETVKWRERIAHQEPNAANQLALAKAALRFGQSELAEHILHTLPEESQQSSTYHQVAAAHALVQKNPALAETHFAAALAIEPQNLQLAVNLAILQLASADAKTSAQAKATLENLTQQPKVRLESLRALTALGLAGENRETAERWAAQLQAETGATFSDSLLHFQAVQGTEAAAAALEELKNKAARSASTVGELIPWLNRHGMAEIAVAWALSLPKEIIRTPPVPMAIAESYSLQQDWNALRQWVEGKNWGEYEAFRLAVESHARHRLDGSARADMQVTSLWRAALKAAQSRPGQLLTLAQLGEGWGYADEAEEAWWMVASSNDNPKAGLLALHRFYKSKQDTRGLLRVAKRALELNPGDLVAANNCASFGLLLTSDSTARRLAAKLHFEHPKNRAFAATYAYALHTEGKLPDGLKVIETLQEQELQFPAIAAYYVVMLVDNGQLDRARIYLPSARRASLLPEEQQLLTAAARKLASDDESPAKKVAGS